MRSLFIGFLLTLLLAVQTVCAQFAEVAGLGLTGVSSSGVAWGDYDNDGDLDLVVTGASSTLVAKIYSNSNGVFTDINAPLTPTQVSSTAWGDYDGDGDLDLLISGYATTLIYKNNGNNSFVPLPFGLPVTSDGTTAWGDYDNDGDLDILLTGNGLTYIYRNNGNDQFVWMNFSMIGYSGSSVDWGDYDNDGDLDVLLTGSNSPTKIYRNDYPAQTYTDLGVALASVSFGSGTWGDYDNDGDLDILLTGNNTSKIYRNDGGTSFPDLGAGLAAFSSSTGDWGDYDNDGDLDILVTGNNQSIVYKNNFPAAFTQVTSLSTGVSSGSCAWGDYDNDGDLDILLTGNGVTKIYRNTTPANANKLPVTPAGLNRTTTATSVTLTWNAGTDVETPANALEYNIYLRNSYNELIVSPMTLSLTNGKRLVQETGNAGQRKSKTVNLVSGTYYWAVQTLDRQGGASPWSPEATFAIGDGKRPAPVITSLSRLIANPDETLEIPGDYFSPALADNSVTLTSTTTPGQAFPVTITQASRYRLVCTLPYATPDNYKLAVKVADKTTEYTTGDITLWGEFRWQKIASTATAKNLNAVFVASPKIAYAAGTDGTIIKTTDIGSSWALLPPGPMSTTNLNTLFFTHPDTGWAAGTLGKIFKTVDKGASWTAQTSGTTNEITSLSFLSGKVGWASGKGGTLLKTVNGGTTWTAVTDVYNGDINQLQFTNSSTGWAVCSAGYVYTTTNAGVNWTPLALGVENWTSLSLSGSAANLVSRGSTSFFYNYNIYNTGTWVSSTLAAPSISFAAYLNPAGVHYGIGKAGSVGVFGDIPTPGTYTPIGATSSLTTEDLNSMHSVANWGLVCGNNGALLVYKPFPRVFASPVVQTLDPESAFPTSATVTLFGAGFNGIDQVKLGNIEVPIIAGSKTDFSLKINTAALTTEDEYFIFTRKGTGDWIGTGRSFKISRYRKKDLKLTPLANGSIGWGDYNNDGYLDILATGYNNNISPYYFSKIYRSNKDGSFTDIQAALAGANESSSAWGDFDKDGDLDIVISGNELNGLPATKVYRNTNGTFASAVTGLYGVSFGSTAWGDFDNDGFPDLVLTGFYSINNINYYYLVPYKNRAGQSFDVATSLTGTSAGAAVLGDFDNDGDLDILSTGYTNTGSATTKIYNNQPLGTFNEWQTLPGVTPGDVAWGDYDNDKDLDILISGSNSSKIYKNNGGLFQDLGAGLENLSQSKAAWVDYDGDGDLDIYLTGTPDASTVGQTNVYRNDAGVFVKINTGIQGRVNGAVSFGDYDNDGDLDLLTTGAPCQVCWGVTEFYENISSSSPPVPEVPHLAYAFQNGKIVLTWTVPENTPAGTTYNLRAGTSAGGAQLISLSALPSGKLTVPQPGNVGFLKTWSYTPTVAGLYYFSVQAVSPSLQPSVFSTELAVAVSNTDLALSLTSSALKVIELPTITSMKVGLDYELKIANTGFFAATGDTIGIYKSSDNVFDAGDEVLLTDTLKLVRGLTTRKKILHITQTLSVGKYYIIIVIDPHKVNQEDTYANNSIVLPLDIPLNDVTIAVKHTHVWSKKIPSIPVSLVVKHFGTQPSTQAKHSKIYLSTDPVRNAEDVVLDSFEVTDELKNDSVVSERAINLKGPLEYGEYYLLAEVATDGDSNPSNNLFSSSLSIAHCDLAVKNFTLPGNVYQYASSLPISFTIKNTAASTEWLSADPEVEINYTPGADPVTGKILLKKLSFRKLRYQDSVIVATTVQLGDEIPAGLGYFRVSLADAPSMDDINSSNNQGTISRQIRATTVAPVLQLGVSPKYSAGETLHVTLTIKDSSRLANSSIYYRSLKKKADQKTVAITTGDETSVIVDINPAGVDDSEGLYIWAVSENRAGIIGTSADQAATLERNDKLHYSIKGGSAISDYQIISFPRKHETNPLLEFTAALGPENKSLLIGQIQNWRLYAYADTSYTAYKSGSFSGLPGSGYWLISKNSKEIEISSGQSISSHTLRLGPAWTLIGNPFDFELDWSQANTDPTKVSALYVFRDGKYSKQSKFKALEGAFVYNSGNDSAHLVLNSFHTSSRIAGSGPDNNLWKVDLSVTKGGLTNSISSVGMLENAAAKVLEPAVPRFIEYVDLVSEDYKVNKIDAASVMMPADTSCIWNYVLKSNITSPATILTWSFETAVDDKELYLYDKENERIVNMREVNTYSLASSSAHHFALYYGSASFIRENLKPKTAMIGYLAPNPHRGTGDLPVAVNGNTEGATVYCEIFDLMGRVLYTASYAVKPGFNTIHLEDLPLLESIALLKCTLVHSGKNHLSVQKIKSQ